MSTYSWSYKAPSKKTTDEADENVSVPAPPKTKQSVGIANVKDSHSERPKRRKNIKDEQQ